MGMTQQSFGEMADLIVALRSRGVPIIALNLEYFSQREQAAIRSAYCLDYHEFARAFAPPMDEVDSAIANVAAEIESAA